MCTGRGCPPAILSCFTAARAASCPPPSTCLTHSLSLSPPPPPCGPQVFSNEGQFRLRFGVRGRSPGQLQRPTGVTVDLNGDIIIADYDNRWVSIFSPEGKFKVRAPWRQEETLTAIARGLRMDGPPKHISKAGEQWSTTGPSDPCFPLLTIVWFPVTASALQRASQGAGCVKEDPLTGCARLQIVWDGVPGLRFLGGIISETPLGDPLATP